MNKCKWVKLGRTEMCEKNCLGEYCYKHNARIKNNHHNRICEKCGLGIRTDIGLCIPCGSRILY